MNAALNTCWQCRTVCNVSSPSWNTGLGGRRASPSAVQSMWAVVGVVGIAPPSSTMRSASIRCTRPRRITLVIRRSCSSSVVVTVEQRYIVGRTDVSSRSRRPAPSSLSNRSSIDVDSAMWRNWSMKPRAVISKKSPGWILARSRYHESRGMIHEMWSGSTPLPSSQRHASAPVLPAPTTT